YPILQAHHQVLEPEDIHGATLLDFETFGGVGRSLIRESFSESRAACEPYEEEIAARNSNS
ncbi:hypothetical protein ACFLSZ_04345, partial [Candidatus Bipolaricaulota bacterium]